MVMDPYREEIILVGLRLEIYVITSEIWAV